MAVDIGQRVRTTVAVVDLAGAPANTNLTVSVTRGDFTAYPAPAVVNDSVGTYHFDVDVDVPGPWVWRATGTAPVMFARSGQFFARSSGARLVSLEEGKRHLNKDLTVVTDDDEIADMVDTSTTLIEEIVGAIVPRTVTESYRGRRAHIYLRQRMRSVTSVTETWWVGDVRVLTAEVVGVSAPADGYRAEPDLGRITRTAGGSPLAFGPDVLVVYVAGRADVPQNFRTAGLELLSHVWRTSQFARGVSRPRPDAQPDGTVVMGYAIPNRVMELLGRSKRAPRIGMRRR